MEQTSKYFILRSNENDRVDDLEFRTKFRFPRPIQAPEAEMLLCLIQREARVPCNYTVEKEYLWNFDNTVEYKRFRGVRIRGSLSGLTDTGIVNEGFTIVPCNNDPLNFQAFAFDRTPGFGVNNYSQATRNLWDVTRAAVHLYFRDDPQQ